MPISEILVHVSGPGTREDDEKYRNLARAYEGFEAVSRIPVVPSVEQRGGGLETRTGHDSDVISDYNPGLKGGATSSVEREPDGTETSSRPRASRVVEEEQAGGVLQVPRTAPRPSKPVEYIEDTGLAAAVLESQLTSSSLRQAGDIPPNSTYGSSMAYSTPAKRDLTQSHAEVVIDDSGNRCLEGTPAIGHDEESSEHTSDPHAQPPSRLAGSTSPTHSTPRATSKPNAKPNNPPLVIPDTTSPPRPHPTPQAPSRNTLPRPHRPHRRQNSRKTTTPPEPHHILPPPPTPSLSTHLESSITPLLADLASTIDLHATFLQRARLLRAIEPWERGYWVLSVSSPLWPAESEAAREHDRAAVGEFEEGSPTGETAASPQCQAWDYLRRFVGEGSAGWGVSCAWEREREGEGEDDVVRVYCWGEAVSHVYLLLYVATQSRVGRVGARWVDADGRVVVDVPPRAGGKGGPGVAGGRKEV